MTDIEHNYDNRPSSLYVKHKPWAEDSDPDVITIRCKISTPSSWFDVNNHDGYELAGDTRQVIQVTHRKQTIQSPYVPGTFTVNAVKENVTESMSWWVRGADHHDMEVKVRRLCEAISQPDYYIDWTVEEHTEVWLCQTADYSVETRREYLHARLAMVKAQIPRYPEVLYDRYKLPGHGLFPR